MLLWSHWLLFVAQLRPTCSRQRTFLWRGGPRRPGGPAGSRWSHQNVRALGLKSGCYGCLLDFFHSPALCVDALARTWGRVVLQAHPGVQRVNGRLVLIGRRPKKIQNGQKDACGQIPASGLGCQHQARVHHGAFVPGARAAGSGREQFSGDSAHGADSRGPRLLEQRCPHPARQVPAPPRGFATARTGAPPRRCLLCLRQSHLRPARAEQPSDFTAQEKCLRLCGAGATPTRRGGRPKRYGKKIRLPISSPACCKRWRAPSTTSKASPCNTRCQDLLWRPAGASCASSRSSIPTAAGFCCFAPT